MSTRALRRLALVFLSCAMVLPGNAARAADTLTYVVHEPIRRTAHPPLIILLHGSGSDERDMIGMWPQLPDTLVVVSPRGPIADRAGGYRWYGRDPATRGADIAISRKAIDRLIDDAVKRYDADPRRVFLGGFSQGAVMVYEVALREPGRFRGAAVLSGSMFPAEQAALVPTTERSHEAFFLGHGSADPRIPIAAARSARAELARLGVPTEFHIYPGMGHGTGETEMADLAIWLAARLSR